jgi:hypothetical protein
MSFPLKHLIPLCAIAIVASLALAQTAPPAPKSQLTPRELFYYGSPAQDSQHKTQRKDQSGRGPKGGGTKTGDTQIPDGTELPGGGHVIRTSTAPPIGITYTLQKQVGDAMVDVSPSSEFHTKERIVFVVQTNYAGYLYIGNKGPTGSWNPLFPSAELDHGNNRVEAFRKYTMPPGRHFYFDEVTGVEEVFILFSRERVPDFEKLLYTEKPGANSGAKPLNVAKAELPGDMVDRLRTTYSRDLLIEKIDDEKPGDRKEKAVYIVNPTGKPDSHVWADLRLVHK